MISFYVDGGDCWSVLFAKLGSVHYVAVEGQVTIDCELGTFIVTGPKALEFHDEFRDHRASKVKADKTDILSVTLVFGRPLIWWRLGFQYDGELAVYVAQNDRSQLRYAFFVSDKHFSGWIG
jgi:hypothetical protein